MSDEYISADKLYKILHYSNAAGPIEDYNGACNKNWTYMTFQTYEPDGHDTSVEHLKKAINKKE